VVFLEGNPAVGKSRLVAEARTSERLRARALARGPRALFSGRHLSYWAVHRDLEGVFEIENTDAEAQAWRKLEQAARELFDARASEIVPYLGTVLSLGMTGEYEQRVKFLDAQALGRQVFLSMRQLFEQLAWRQPILVVMEDWHWVDHSSVALCEHLLPLRAASGDVLRRHPARIPATRRAHQGRRVPQPRLTLSGDRARSAWGGPE